MVKLSSLITIGSVGVFLWYIFTMIYQVLILFYPTLYIPFITKEVGVGYHEQYWSLDHNFKLSIFQSTSSNSKLLFKSEKETLPIFNKDISSFELKEINENLKINLPKKVSKGKSDLYLHCFIYDINKSPNNQLDNFDGLLLQTSIRLTKPLKFLPNITRNLLEDDDKKVIDLDNQPILPHFKDRVQLELVIDRTLYPKDQIPHDVSEKLLLLNPELKYYLPLFEVNEIGLRRIHYLPINNTQQLNINLSFRKASLGMYRIHNHFSKAFEQFKSKEAIIKISDLEIDNLRQMFFETPPTLLALTFLAAFLHMLFDFLAFKSDVMFWKNKDNLHGTSKSSVIMSSISLTLSFFYLLDKRNDTSKLVLGGALVSAIVEYYKVYRVYRLRPIDTTKLSKSEQDYLIKAEKETKLVDSQVFRYTLMLSLPITLTYSLYTLNYHQYQSYYSWLLESIMALTYLLGFINMVPQVVINHKLRSVEAIPLASFFYKAINTFVDDLFVLVIPMPNLARLAAFRDDLIFFIFLYQWYTYPVRKQEDEVEKKDQ